MFEGFRAADFDAFERKKWGSNVYTLERRGARDRLLALGEALAAIDELDGLELATTEDVPSVANGRRVKSLAAVFLRGPDERRRVPKREKTDLSSAAGLFEIALHQKHAHVFCEVDHEGFTSGFRIPSQALADRVNLTEKLAFEWARQELDERSAAIPGGAEWTVGPEHFGVREAPGARLLAGATEPVVVGLERRWSRNEESLSSDALLDELLPYVRSVAACFHFLAWSPDNDHDPIETVLQESVQKAEAQANGMRPGDRVTILSGLFSGRAGYLSEVDAKGRAKVMVGPVSVTVPVEDLRGS